LKKIIELSHVIKNGKETYPGLPAPHICDFWTRKQSAQKYSDGETFHIGQITMVANTGTYIDAPFHRYQEGADISQLKPENFADLRGHCIAIPKGVQSIGKEYLTDIPNDTEAVLFYTGWDKHWSTPEYKDQHPYLSVAAAESLQHLSIKLVGIDSINIDNIHNDTRPIHSLLLAEGILIVEHLTGLSSLNNQSFVFHAAPAPVEGMGTFPVRAYAILD